MCDSELLNIFRRNTYRQPLMRMKLLRIILFFYFFSSYGTDCYAQTRIIDSLKRNVWEATSNKEKSRTLLELCRQKYSLTADSLYHYAVQVRELNREEPEGHNKILADYYIAYSLLINGKEDSSLKITNNYLEKLKSNKNEQEGRINE